MNSAFCLPDMLCTQLGIICMSGPEVYFRGLSKWGAGPSSPVGYISRGEHLFIGHLQGLGQCLWGGAQAICPMALDARRTRSVCASDPFWEPEWLSGLEGEMSIQTLLLGAFCGWKRLLGL